MKKTYEELKQANDLKVADWFEPSNVPSYAGIYGWRRNFTIVRETEKAVQIEVEATSRDGEYDFMVKVWVPKACFESRKDYFEKEAKREQAFEDGKARYEKLLAFCKEHGVKGARLGLKTSTLMGLVNKAGLVYAA